MDVPARGERSLPVLSYIHRAPDRVAFGHSFEYVADTGSLVMMAAAAAHLRALDFPADVARQEFAAMASHQLLAFLFEEKGVDGVIPRIGNLDVPLSAHLSRGARDRRLLAAWRIRKQLVNPRRNQLIVARHHHIRHDRERVVTRRQDDARIAV